MNLKYIAHIVIEAKTPLKVGSNASDIFRDSPVQKDWNGLPMILGTSIAGVLRKDFDKENVEDIFGDEKGSKLIISNALLVDEKNRVTEDLLLEKSDFLKYFENLPVREHTRITDKGGAGEYAKFDEEVVYKGSRFKFSLELRESDEMTLHKILNVLGMSSFRLGSGSSKGFGKFKIHTIKTQTFPLDKYTQYSSSLNYKLKKNFYILQEKDSSQHTKYLLKISPDDFYIFGSGLGDSQADSTPAYEYVLDYDTQSIREEYILFPASSLKGALSHRTTYHYNLQTNRFIESTKEKKPRGVISEIFGLAKDKDAKAFKGKVLLSDCFAIKKETPKVFDHVSIDRFTGGARDGALFQEKTIAQKDEWEIEILLEKGVDEVYVKAFESALKDIATGMLALGGMTGKGHGVFNGELFKDGEKYE